MNPSVTGYQENPAFAAPERGRPGGAKQLLRRPACKTPYPIKFTYPGGTPTTDKQAAALKDGWDKAGFKVTLDPLTGHLLRRDPEARRTTPTSSGAAGVLTGPRISRSSRRCSTAGST